MPERIMISKTRAPRTPPTILGTEEEEEEVEEEGIGVVVMLEGGLKGEVEVTLKAE